MKAAAWALAAGLMFALALPPYNLELLGWSALAPLLVVAIGRSPLEAIGLGMLAGFAGGALQARWAAPSFALLLAYLPFLWLALFFGVVAAGGMYMRKRGWSRLPWIVFVACAGVAVEWLTTFTPLPLNIALSQYLDLPVIQVAAFTGIWGVSFLLWLINASIADAALSKPRRPVPFAICVGLAALVTVGCSANAVGAWRSSTPMRSVRVAAIQDYSAAETAGVLAETKDVADAPDRAVMTRAAVQKGAKLVVWSEECLGAAYQPSDPNDETNALARKTSVCLVVGYSDNHEPHPHNCAGLILPDGSSGGVYHKFHLFMGERQVVTPGHGTTAFVSPFGKIGMEICFDSLYTNITRGLVKHGAQIVAMPNFDPPTPRGILHNLHCAMLPLRAVENRVPIVRSDSNGESQIVGKSGRVIGQGPLWQPDVLVGTVALGTGAGTFFTQWGDWFAYLCVLIMLGCMISAASVPKSKSLA